MDPVTISAVAAVAAIATALSNGIASAAGKDAYEGMKRVVSRRFTAAEPALLEMERAPALASSGNALATRLEELGAFRDAEFRERVQALLETLNARRGAPEVSPLFDFDALEVAGRFEMTDITAFNTVIKTRTANFKGNVTISGVHQTRGDPEKH